ncbi:MAG: AMP-binding protein [Alphaproteobacteria bacterium]|nr:AMP-binding protein [Alphaproteobacteria bacterium]
MEWYPKRRFGDLADEMAARFPDAEALVDGDLRLTFTELAARIDDAAKRLIAAGVASGENVALWLNNQAEWMFIAFAVQKIGAVLVPLNTRFRTRDIAYVLGQSDSVLLITHDVSGPVGYLDMVREAVDLPAQGTAVSDTRFPHLRAVIIVEDDGPSKSRPGVVSWNDLVEPGKAVADETLSERANRVDPDAVTFIMYTSGTTGFPKGVMHSHKLIRNVEERGFRMGITPNDVILNYLPLFHAFGYSEGALMSLVTGAKQVLTRSFDPDECLDLIAGERATLIHGFEAHMKGLTEAQEIRPRDLSSLRCGIFAAGMLSATPITTRGARVLAPLTNISGFGMTETWIGVALCSIDDDAYHRCETSGYPSFSYEIRVADPDTNAETGVGEPGELQVRGYSLMLGYYNKPEDTAASYTNDGWFKTGDTVMWLERGYIRLVGRHKDMLKVGGENVDPMETEALLLEHPEVHQVAVVGRPDAAMSEVAVAYIERAPGSGLTEEAVIAFCQGQVASFKIPRHVVFVDAFPMTASGKIRKADLREDAVDRFKTSKETTS